MRFHVSLPRLMPFAACLVVLVFLSLSGVYGRDDPAEDPPRKKLDLTTANLEARLVDDSTLRVTLRESTLDIVTQYGKMSVPLTEIRRIDFATRVPDDLVKKIDALVDRLGDPEEKVREEAMLELLRHKALALPALQKATKSLNVDLARRAEGMIERVRDLVPEEQLELRKQDIIHTDDMKIAGRIDMQALKIHTRAFGEVSLKLTELRSLRTSDENADIDVVLTPGPAPASVTHLSNNIGQKYAWKVTGVGNGTIYGTDTYTTDSSLAMAAVHAGVLKVGQTGVVRIQIIGQHAGFISSTKHGLTSHAYGAHPAFKILK